MKFISSLKSKIYFLLFVPLFIAVCLTGHLIHTDWSAYQKAFSDEKQVEVIHLSLILIQQVQAERGRSAMFLNGNATQDELDTQRKTVNTKMQSLVDAVKLSEKVLPSDTQSVLDRAVKTLEGVRTQVDAKGNPPEVSKIFGTVVDTLIELEVLNARASTFESQLNGPILLEISKENAGKMRALVTNILGANKSIPMATTSALESMMAAINTNINSPILKVTEAGQKNLGLFKASSDWTQVRDVYRVVLDKSAEGDFGQDPKLFFAAITSAINQLYTIGEAELVAVKIEVLDNMKASKTRMIWISGLSVAVFIFVIGFASFVVRSITGPINQSVTELKENTDSVLEAFEQLRSASHQMSSGTAQGAASLEETVASVEEISSMLNQNAKSAQEATVLTLEGRKLAETGETDIKSMVVNMNELSESSKKIEEITEIIDDIAFQINLLALNAAVEAARAGEQGKGFAVVAEAVRELAQKSAVAAKDITGLIHESVEKTRNGAIMANTSGEALGKIVGSVRHIHTLIEEISNSSQEQSRGLSQITQAMNELDRTTQSNAASAEETSASAESLQTQANSMQNLVKRLNMVVEGGSMDRKAS